jgi:Cu(I)/Ag(I) efflux system membrane fusion protein/cobalt-zinc-cadmium efflux system membrane fusion protein
MAATTTLFGAACGGASEQNTSGNATPAATPSASGQNVEVTLTSQPDPPTTGENTFEVMVMSGGQPVTDADVSVEFFMAAMPAMKMPEMRNTVPLKHEGDGRYRGAGNVMMAGNWDATVRVTRNGQDIGSQKFPITAK